MGNSLSEIHSIPNEEVSTEIIEENDALVADVYTKVLPEKRIKQLEDELFNLEEQYNELHFNYTRLSLKLNITNL
jgi:hypothetical protein